MDDCLCVFLDESYFVNSKYSRKYPINNIPAQQFAQSAEKEKKALIGALVSSGLGKPGVSRDFGTVQIRVQSAHGARIQTGCDWR